MLAGRYFTEGADEVTFLNITGFRDFPLGDLPMLEARLQTEALQSTLCPCCSVCFCKSHLEIHQGSRQMLL